MSGTLKYTIEQVRDRELQHLGTKGLPAAWWTLPAGNDCVGFQMWILGLRSPSDFSGHVISISLFRAWALWPEVPTVSIKAGDLVLENWGGSKDDNGELAAEHMEWVYSVDHDGKTITTISANTGPEPGNPIPRGVWKKTRPLTEHFVKGIRVPYADAKVSNARKTEVRANAAWLNHQNLGRQSAAAEDGIEGENYWWMIQRWGHLQRIYPKACVEDGIPGRYTRAVEKVVTKLARRP